MWLQMPLTTGKCGLGSSLPTTLPFLQPGSKAFSIHNNIYNEISKQLVRMQNVSESSLGKILIKMESLLPVHAATITDAQNQCLNDMRSKQTKSSNFPCPVQGRGRERKINASLRRPLPSPSVPSQQASYVVVLIFFFNVQAGPSSRASKADARDKENSFKRNLWLNGNWSLLYTGVHGLHLQDKLVSTVVWQKQHTGTS